MGCAWSRSKTYRLWTRLYAILLTLRDAVKRIEPVHDQEGFDAGERQSEWFALHMPRRARSSVQRAGVDAQAEELHRPLEAEDDDEVLRCSRCDTRLTRKSFAQTETEAFLWMEIHRVGICERCATPARMRDAETNNVLGWSDVEMALWTVRVGTELCKENKERHPGCMKFVAPDDTTFPYFDEVYDATGNGGSLS